MAARYQAEESDSDKVNAFAEELRPLWADALRHDAALSGAVRSLAELSPIYRQPEHIWPWIVRSNNPVSVFRGVYRVRNNLFHGSKEFDSARDHSLVRTSTTILERTFFVSGLYMLARAPGGELTDPLRAHYEAPTSTAEAPSRNRRP